MIKNQLNILGQGVAIKFTSSRHYSVLISKRYEALDKFTEENSKSIFLSIDNKSDRQVSKKKKRKIAENYIINLAIQMQERF